MLLPAKGPAQRYADALEARGIPVILRMADNVADSPAAAQWRSLLHALDRPASTARVAAVALGWCFEWAPERIAAAVDDPDDRDLVELQHQLVGWAEVLGSGGVAALFGEIRRTTDLVPNVLRGADGERNLTDLEHLAELLSAETHIGGHGSGRHHGRCGGCGARRPRRHRGRRGRRRRRATPHRVRGGRRAGHDDPRLEGPGVPGGAPARAVVARQAGPGRRRPTPTSTSTSSGASWTSRPRSRRPTRPRAARRATSRRSPTTRPGARTAATSTA